MPETRKHNEGDHPTFPLPAEFPSFPLLPPEIATRIITLACRSPEQSCQKDEEVKKRSPLALDVQTTLNLARVSRSISKVATSTLYESIRITKPSALLELHATLQARPELAKLLRSLHIGGEVTLPNSEWPLWVDYRSGSSPPLLRLRESTIPPLSEGEQDRGLSRTISWPVQLDEEEEGERRRTWYPMTVRAIRSALEHLDIDPYKREYGKSGKKIGLELWATRTFELQACLDLYLMEVRRLEAAIEHKTPSHGDTARFPPLPPLPRCPELAVTGFSYASSHAASDLKSSPGLLVLSRAQIWQHLTRRGSALDQFDHPIIFARTGFCSSSFNDYGRALIGQFLKGPYPRLYAANAGQATGAPTQPPPEDPALHEESTIISGGFAPRFTVRGLMTAAIDVISLAKNLVSMSLLGSLDLCLSIPLETYSTLRSLGLGPLLPVWQHRGALHGSGGQMEELESLRICGSFVVIEEAKQIAGKDGLFPKLKRFQWELVESFRPYVKPSVDPEQLIEKIRRLQGTPINIDSPQPPSRLIEVRLHPDTCKSIFELLPKPTRTAWKANKRLDIDGKGALFAPHRIRITESDAAKCGSDHAEIGVRRLHQGARKWFEECAALAKKGDDKSEEWMPSSGGGYSLAPRRLPKFSYGEEKKEEYPDGSGWRSSTLVTVLDEETESEGEQETFQDWARICGERED